MAAALPGTRNNFPARGSANSSSTAESNAPIIPWESRSCPRIRAAPLNCSLLLRFLCSLAITSDTPQVISSANRLIPSMATARQASPSSPSTLPIPIMPIMPMT